MRRYAALAGLVRQAARASAAACLGLVLSVLPAQAGDRAGIELIGHSEDGRTFAFEEFGIQDGSGFAYSNIFLIDLETDSWVAGSPFRVQSDSEDRLLADIRAEARQAAGKLIAEREITVPAQFIAMIGDGVPETDAQSLRFGVPGFSGPGSVIGDFALSLEGIEMSPHECEAYMDTSPQGFALELTAEEKTVEIHRDTVLPKSRGCAQSYRLFGVAAPFGTYKARGLVTLLSVFTLGFEGPDRRFLAVPIPAQP